MYEGWHSSILKKMDTRRNFRVSRFKIIATFASYDCYYYWKSSECL